VITRLALPLLVTAAQLCAAALVLGRPDADAALAFLGGGWPTAAGTLAALELLVWVIVLAAGAWSLGSLALGLVQRAASSPRLREGSALATGLLILMAGVMHHLGSHVDMSGGSVSEALSVLGR
jgi:hypothetical protein